MAAFSNLNGYDVYDYLPKGLQALSVVFVLLLLGVFIAHKVERRGRLQLDGIPVVPGPKSWDFRETLQKANAKYSNQPYMVPFQDPTVIIPAHCIEGLKNLPDSQVSTNGSMYERFAIRWTNSGWVDKELAHSIKYDLSNEMDSLFPALLEEIKTACDQNLRAADVWNAFDVQDSLVHVVGPVIGRMMVGAPLHRSKSWLDASIDHAIAAVTYSTWLRLFPVVLRPIMAHLLPQKRALDRSKAGIREAVDPLIQQHLSRDSKIAEKSEEGRLAGWLLKRYRPETNSQFLPDMVLRDHYSLCFAAIHGPTFLIVQAIIDLASYPQYLARLRKEVDRELSATPFLGWTRETVSRLTFVDAFCKESARRNPQGVVAWLRKTHQPVTIATGHTIPANTLIAAVNPLYSPEAVPWIEDPDRFYPERWLKPSRDSSHPDDNHRFGSATTDSLIFGYGKHACPGRPMGITMVKAIVAYMISEWDFRLPDGQTTRPENIHMDFMVMPPIPPLGKLKLEIKERKR